MRIEADWISSENRKVKAVAIKNTVKYTTRENTKQHQHQEPFDMEIGCLFNCISFPSSYVPTFLFFHWRKPFRENTLNDFVENIIFHPSKPSLRSSETSLDNKVSYLRLHFPVNETILDQMCFRHNKGFEANQMETFPCSPRVWKYGNFYHYNNVDPYDESDQVKGRMSQ